MSIITMIVVFAFRIFLKIISVAIFAAMGGLVGFVLGPVFGPVAAPFLSGVPLWQFTSFIGYVSAFFINEASNPAPKTAEEPK